MTTKMKTYWDETRGDQKIIEELNRRVPDQGKVIGKENKALERFRKASNAYYDIFNNGGMNRRQEIRAVFGISMTRYQTYGSRYGSYQWDRIYEVTEPIMDEIVRAAAIEQRLIAPAPIA